MRSELKWTLAYSDTPEGELSAFYPAKVPGTVQEAMAALGMPSYMTGDHEDEYRWMEDKYWHCRASFSVPAEGHSALILEGVDYEYDLFVNGEKLLHHEGMFTGTRTELDRWRGQDISVLVLIYPAPKVPDCRYERGLGNEAAQSCKSAFSYGWDWCPRHVTLGIDCPVYISTVNEADIVTFDCSYRLSEALDEARLCVSYALSAKCEASLTLTDPAGRDIRTEALREMDGNLSFTLPAPLLWYPCGYGEQPVYTLTLRTPDTAVRRNIGFRRVRLETNEGTWEEQMATDIKSCARPPMTLSVNGERIFAAGSNWVPPEMSRSMLDKERTAELLRLLKDANMNIIRIWGGGYIHPRWFYDLCDSMGILVWQEFPLACSDYFDNDRYLNVLRRESVSILRQLRLHPCLALWCGGNELFTDWSRMTPQRKAVRLLDAMALEEDGDTPFIYTSPQAGVGHGPYELLLSDGRETLEDFCDGDYAAYTEFGCGAPSEYEYLESFMSAEELARPFASPIWEKRHAVRWFHPESIRKLTGCADDLRSLTVAGNEAQCAMYAAMFEEVRRQWPHASMAINWCFNEPWPTAAGNGLVNYPALPRPSYWAVKDALRPRKLSLRFRRIAWRPGEEMELTCFLLNGSSEAIPGGEAEIKLAANGMEAVLGRWAYDELAPRTNEKGIVIRFTVPSASDGRLSLLIRSQNDPALNAEYRLFAHEGAV